MRSLLVVVGIALVGCSSAVEGDAPLPACSSNFSGAWELRMQNPRKNEKSGSPLCSFGMKEFLSNVSVDPQLSTWTESYESGAVQEFKIRPFDQADSCSKIIAGADATDSTDESKTMAVAHAFHPVTADLLLGATVTQLYNTADINAESPTPLCETIWYSSLTRVP